MPRRKETDERQTDFFGIPAVDAPAPKPRVTRREVAQKAKATPAAEHPCPSLDSQAAPEKDTPETLASGFSPAEWDDIAAGLPDDVLAHLVIVTIRQLRRRLAHSRRQPGQNPAPALERAARQIIAELGEPGGDDNAGPVLQRHPVARRRSR